MKDDELAREMSQVYKEAMASRPGPEGSGFRGSTQDFLKHKAQQKAAKKQQLTVRFDEDMIQKYKELAGEDGSYQRLMNQALKEWLQSKEMREVMREVVREELEQALKKSA